MRLIGTFTEEEKLERFRAFLSKEGIESTYDTSVDKKLFSLWIINEDVFDQASAWYQDFLNDPKAERFEGAKTPISLFPNSQKASIQNEAEPSSPSQARLKWKIGGSFTRVSSSIAVKRFSLTYYLILLCTLLFIISIQQASQLEQEEGEVGRTYLLTPMQKLFFFDYDQTYLTKMQNFLQAYGVKTEAQLEQLQPKEIAEMQQIEDVRSWQGLANFWLSKEAPWKEVPPGTLFGKIRQGEVWRLFTPCLLHAGLLHIFFNMAWLWLLGKQLEVRLGIGKMLLLILTTGVVANCAQYLVGGSNFLGFSGVVMGMVGFIWMRQKLAPWEGYPLQRSTTLFIVIFVGAMLLLELLAFTLQFFSILHLSGGVANTAHVIGGLVGVALGRLRFFARSVK